MSHHAVLIQIAKAVPEVVSDAGNSQPTAKASHDFWVAASDAMWTKCCIDLVMYGLSRSNMRLQDCCNTEVAAGNL